MKISELMEALAKMQALNGDVDVLVYGTDQDGYDTVRELEPIKVKAERVDYKGIPPTLGRFEPDKKNGNLAILLIGY